MKTIICCALIVFLALNYSPLMAQYWGEQVLEKGFEQTDFFFVPHNLLPYGIGSFKSTTPGLLDDPLQNLAVNPALIRIDSGRQGYLYTDFRSARTIADQSSYYPVPMYANTVSDVAVLRYSSYYLNTRRVLEPVFSGAYLGLPFPQMLPTFVLGASYQFMLQDDKYYDVPQDIYRSVLGEDFSGNKAEAASSLPIVDRYSGDDNMHQKGHLIDAFSRFEIPSLGSIGIKIGRVLFDRSGEIGSTNLWAGYTNPANGTSLWSNMESRSQNYNHWEFTGGVEVYLNEKTSLGATVSGLWGTATQSLHRADSSYYNYPSSSNSSQYLSSGYTQQDWKHDGTTILCGVDLTSRITSQHTLKFLFQHMKSNIDIGLGSTIRDTSYSNYSYTYLDTLRTSIYNSFLRDTRSGSGTQVITSDKASFNMQWQIDERTNLSLGFQFDWQTMEMNTTEYVLASMLSMSQSNYYGYYQWINGSDQSKDLHWTFTTERTNFQIPIFITIKASNAISILLGLNRSMISSKVTEITLAVNHYNQSNYNGTITRNENYGERYTTPTETVSDVQTTFLAGITASPAKEFQVRLLVVPNFHDAYDGSKMDGLQWWISLNIFP
jgi:hypothetical protein